MVSYIFVLALCFIIISCSKTGSSGIIVHAQSNTQTDNSGSMVVQGRDIMKEMEQLTADM